MTSDTSALKGNLDDVDVDWHSTYADLLPRVYNYFRYRFNDDPTAEDLTAATFEKAWRGRHRYRRDMAAFSTWIFTIARHVAADHLKSRRVLLPLDDVSERDDGQPLEDTIGRKMDLERLQGLLSRLPERERDLISLKYGAEMTNREIAHITGLSESNVGTILHRVTVLLRSQWEAQ